MVRSEVHDADCAHRMLDGWTSGLHPRTHLAYRGKIPHSVRDDRADCDRAMDDGALSGPASFTMEMYDPGPPGSRCVNDKWLPSYLSHNTPFSFGYSFRHN